MTRQKVAHGTTYEPSFSLDFHERDVYGAPTFDGPKTWRP